MSVLLGVNWRTTLSGVISAALLFLQSYLSNNKTLNWHDPALLIGVALAVLGFTSKDKQVTGGTTLSVNAVPDAVLHEQAAEKESK